MSDADGVAVLTACGRTLTESQGMLDADYKPNLCGRCWPGETNTGRLGHLVVTDEQSFDIRTRVTSWRLVVVDVAEGLRISYSGTIDVGGRLHGVSGDDLRALHRQASAIHVGSVSVDGPGTTEALRQKVKFASSRTSFRNVARWVAQGADSGRGPAEEGRLLGWAASTSGADERAKARRERLELVAKVVGGTPFGTWGKTVAARLGVSEQYARELIAECRRPEVALLPPAKPRGRRP